MKKIINIIFKIFHNTKKIIFQYRVLYINKENKAIEKNLRILIIKKNLFFIKIK